MRRMEQVGAGFEGAVAVPAALSARLKDRAGHRPAVLQINLHFRDLRHEAGSRWLETVMPLHHIKEILGHANISQTDTYLNARRVALQESMKRFDAARGKPVARDTPTEQRPPRHEETEAPSKDLLH